MVKLLIKGKLNFIAWNAFHMPGTKINDFIRWVWHFVFVNSLLISFNKRHN
jgi:hypothetical protein